jgi:hypothetical protein
MKRLKEPLSDQGEKLLRLLLAELKAKRFALEDSHTYPTYQDCCYALKLAEPGQIRRWGDLLQRNSLTDLNVWTIRNRLPQNNRLHSS